MPRQKLATGEQPGTGHVEGREEERPRGSDCDADASDPTVSHGAQKSPEASMDERTEQGTSGSILSELLTQGRRVARAGMRKAETELKEDAREAGKGSLLLGASAWMGLTGLSALVLAAAMALPRNPVRGVVLAGLGLLGGSVALGVLGVRTLPERPLSQTTQALKEGAAVLKENLT